MPRHNFIKMIALMAAALNGIACFGYPYNFGSVWNQWNNEARMAYMWGFQDGSSQAYLATAKFVFKLDSIPTKQPIKLRKITNAIHLKHRLRVRLAEERSHGLRNGAEP